MKISLRIILPASTMTVSFDTSFTSGSGSDATVHTVSPANDVGAVVRRVGCDTGPDQSREHAACGPDHHPAPEQIPPGGSERMFREQRVRHGFNSWVGEFWVIVCGSPPGTTWHLL